MTPRLDKNIGKLMEIANHLDEIERLKAEYNIVSAKAIFDDKRAKNLVCREAAMLYDTALGCDHFGDKRAIKKCRASLTHHEDTLKGNDGTVGFNRISPDEIWRDHLSSNGCVNKIRDNLQRVINSQQEVRDAVHAKSIKDKNTPFKLSSSGDFPHLQVIRESGKAVEDGMMCIAGLLFFLSKHQTPPTIDKLAEFVSTLLKLRVDQVMHSVESLVHYGVVTRSKSESILLITKQDFIIGAAIDFVDTFDLDRVIEQYEVLINE